MASKQFLVPGNHATVRGIVAPGATASLYTTGTTTPQPFYSDESRLVSLGSTITADGIGNFPVAYQDETIPFRLILKNRLGTELDGGDIDPFYFGVTTLTLPASASSYATRTDMAAVSATTGSMAYLREAGREGMFVWSTANNAANVTADPAQAIYVAPASGTTGAAGAWVRRFSGPKNAKWYGATGDGTTDDATALQRWLDAGGYLLLPAAEYYSSAKLIVRKSVVIDGEGYGFDSRTVDGTATLGYDNQPGSRIRFAAGIGGLDIQPQTTVTDPAGVLTAIQEGAKNSVIRHIALVGAGTGAAAVGVYCRTHIHLEDVHALKFQGKGFDISATPSVDGYGEYGDANCSTLKGCVAIYNGSHGFHIRGANANACTFINCWSQLNGGWGYLDESLNGNTYIGGQAATNTLGSYKCVRSVANSSYLGCYAETGTGLAPDLSSRCNVFGGYLADAAYQFNVASNGNPVITTANGVFLNKVTYIDSQASAAISGTKANVYRHANNGLTLQGAPNGGGTYDVSIVNKSDSLVQAVATGTTTSKFFGTVWADFSPFFVNGSSAFPGLIATQAAMFTTATGGLVLAGFGSTYDTALANKSGTVALGVLTGTVNVTAAGSLAATGAVTGSNLSGTNTGDQTITLTGNVTGTGTGSFAATIANDAVTYAKMQNVSATNRFLGRITAGAGDPEELTGTQASTLLDAATTSLQGAMSAQDKTRMDAAFTVYRSLLDCSGSITAAQAAATYGMGQGDPLAVSGTGTLYPLNSIFIAAADYPAVGTLNPKLRIRVNVYCNDVAPGVTFTVGLHPITRPATSGGAGVCIYTIGSAVASSTIAVTTPAADSSNAAVTAADFSLPADGHYVIGVVTSGGSLAASSHCHLSAVLQMRYA